MVALTLTNLAGEGEGTFRGQGIGMRAVLFRETGRGAVGMRETLEVHLEWTAHSSPKWSGHCTGQEWPLAMCMKFHLHRDHHLPQMQLKE